MYRLVYFSSATQAFDKKDLVELLTQSRINNKSLGVTGMLLYKEGDFMQILEGEKAVVLQLLEKIKKDKRHNSLIVVLEEEADDSVFSEWSMGFRDMEDASLEGIEGYNRLMNLTRHLTHGESYASQDCLHLLNIFRGT